MNAEQAKKQALANKKLIEESNKVREQTVFDDNVKLLYDHLKNKVEKAVREGQLATEKIEFPAERFHLDVVREVSVKLKLDGFILTMDHHNAYNKTIFVVSFA